MEAIQLLIVDDNEDDFELLVRSLDRVGGGRVNCSRAHTCQEALATLDKRLYDCTLLDYNLPDCTGPGLLETVRERHGELPCSFIMLTGMGGERLVVDLMKAGVFDYFNKSAYEPEDLLYAVEQASQVTRLKRELKLQSVRRAAAEEELRQAQLHSAELAGVRKAVATFMHELNSPLTGLLNCIDMLLTDDPKPDHEQWLLEMRDASRRMAQVVNRMSELEELRPRPGGGPPGPLDLSLRAGSRK
jgi:DNA-binding NtrC family response regulator